MKQAVEQRSKDGLDDSKHDTSMHSQGTNSITTITAFISPGTRKKHRWRSKSWWITSKWYPGHDV